MADRSQGKKKTQVKQDKSGQEKGRTGQADPVKADPVKAGPLRYGFHQLAEAIKGIGQLFRHPKLLIPTLILAGLWPLLAFLKMQFAGNIIFRTASYLTFAQGGLYGGFIGAVGGVLGKTFFAWFITMSLTPLLTGVKPDKVKREPLKKSKAEPGLSLFLLGWGLALCVYNFMTGDGRLQNSVVGVTAFLSCRRMLKRERGGMIDFVRAFTRGRWSQNPPRSLVKGLGFGFMLGVATSFFMQGFFCYLIGAAFSLLGMMALMMGTGRRARARLSAMLLILSLFAPFLGMEGSVQAADYQNPYEVYGIDPNEPLSNMHLVNAMQDAPPASMKLTPVATGDNDFSSSAALSGAQTVDAENGISDIFSVTSLPLEEYRFSSSVQLHLEADGWYADASTSYEANNGFTEYKTVSGSEKTDKKCYFIITQDAIDAYLYDAYCDPGFVYISIPVPFAYSQMGLEDNSWSSGTQILARVDGVALEMSEETGGQTATGAWKLIDTKAYRLVLTDYGAGTMITEPIEGRAGVDDGRDLNLVEVDGYRIRYRSNFSGSIDYNAEFEAPPGMLSAEAPLSIGIVENNTMDGTSVGSVSGALWLAGERPQTYSSGENDRNELGVDLSYFFLERQGDRLMMNVPQGADGERATLEMVMGTTALGAVVLANVYEWDSDLAALPPTDGSGGETTSEAGEPTDETDVYPPEDSQDWQDETEDEEASDPFSGWTEDLGEGLENWIPGMPGVWPAGIGSIWGEPADGMETIIINGVAVVGGIIGAGAAAAGLGGSLGAGGGSSGLGTPEAAGGRGDIPNSPDITYDPSDDSVVVKSPNGSSELYRRNPKTGQFEDSRGNQIDLGDVDRANRELQRDLEASRRERERMEKGEDGDSQYWHKVNRLEHLKKRLEQEGGSEPDSIENRMIRQIEKMQKAIDSGDGLDQSGYERIRNAYGKLKAGQLADERSLPGTYTSWQQTKDAINMSGEELARGESAKATAVRVLAGILTGGKSEIGFEAAKSIYTVKDYVNAGGDSWREAVSIAATNTIVDEGIGRVVEGGIGLAGKAGSAAADLAKKTDLGRRVVDGVGGIVDRTGQFFGTNVRDLVSKTLKQSAKEADQGAKAVKSGVKQLDDWAKTAAGKTDDALEGALGKAAKQADGPAIKADGPATKTDSPTIKGNSSDAKPDGSAIKADSPAAKPDGPAIKPKDSPPETGKAVDSTSGKTGAASEPSAGSVKKELTKDSPEYKAASAQVDQMEAEAKKAAQKKIDEFKAANTQKTPRDEAFEMGQKEGEKKLADLKRAQEQLERNPNSPQAREAYDEAVRRVQQDKFAVQKINDAPEEVGKDTIAGFNRRNQQYNKATLENTQARLAQERGLDPDKVKFVEATNSGAGMREADASRTARPVDMSNRTAPDTPGAKGPDDIDISQVKDSSAPRDQDVTGRMYDEKTGQWIDLPEEDVARVYKEELYKIHHKGELPKIEVDGKQVVDEEAVKSFAEKMDHTVTDRTGKDAYGRGDEDLVKILNKDSAEIKKFDDVTSVTGTMEYKTNEWFERAEAMERRAAQSGDMSPSNPMVQQAESMKMEGVRQLTKQFKNQVTSQVKAAAAAGQAVKVPERLFASIKVLDEVGKPGGLTVSQAEQILKGMGTSVDDVVKQSSSLMESIARFNK